MPEPPAAPRPDIPVYIKTKTGWREIRPDVHERFARIVARADAASVEARAKAEKDEKRAADRFAARKSMPLPTPGRSKPTQERDDD